MSENNLNESDEMLAGAGYDGDFDGGNVKNDYCIIYLLKNVANGKIYVGQSWYPLLTRMGKNGCNYSHSVYLFNAIKKYGVEKFRYEVLERCKTQEEADESEKDYIEHYDARKQGIGYNIKEGGSAGRHSEETKKKISKNSARHWLGKHLPQETRDKISEANIGNFHTDEWKENNSVFMKERHKIDGHPMQGKHHTEEARKAIGEAAKGRVMPREAVDRGAAKRQMSKEREQEIIAAYLNNDTFKNIIEAFHCNASTVYRLLKRNGIEKRK